MAANDDKGARPHRQGEATRVKRRDGTSHNGIRRRIPDKGGRLAAVVADVRDVRILRYRHRTRVVRYTLVMTAPVDEMVTILAAFRVVDKPD